jgi:hypothetical protein
MSQGQASSGMREQAPVRRCAFCEAPFTARMQAWMGEAAEGCACCGGSILGHWPIKAREPIPPVRDTDELKCDACGKVLYRAQ